MASRNYKYYQPNKKDLKDKYGDCVIRALTKVTGKEWMQVFDELLPYARELQCMSSTESQTALWRLTSKLSIYQKREASRMDKANTGEQPVRLYRNKETGELFTYLEMLEEWRERYEGINPDNGLYQYHWHTRYDYLG